MSDLKARIEITVDQFGNLETRSNVVDLEQQREILMMAIKTLGAPKVYGGVDFGKTRPDISRPLPGN